MKYIEHYFICHECNAEKDRGYEIKKGIIYCKGCAKKLNKKLPKERR